MDMWMHDLAIETFAPMLRTVSEILEKGAAHAAAKGFDPAVLVGARLAPDMFALAEQVRQACSHAQDATQRLTGRNAPSDDGDDASIDALRSRIARTVVYLERVPASAFDGAADKTVEIPMPNGGAIVMNGRQFLRDWALPHFYFHVVTAYAILRHNGVDIGKRDYLSRVGVYIHAPDGKKAARARASRKKTR
jgi:uncharacterized protein